MAPALSRERLWHWSTAPARAPWLSLLIAVAAFAAGAVTLQERMPVGDEPHYLVITQSLLLDGDLRIENNHARHDYLAYFDAELHPDFLRRGLDGQIYSVHAPGLPVMRACVRGGGYPAAALAVAVLSALGLSLLGPPRGG
jgi:hypothetical protein